MTASDLNAVLPQLVLALFALAGLMVAAYTGKDRVAPLLTWTTAGVLVLVAFWVALTGASGQAAFHGMVMSDGFARFVQVAVLLSAAAVLAMSQSYMERRDLLRFEYPVLVVLACVGMMFMVSAGNLMTLYLGLELQSLALYVVAALRRDSVKSTEAGLKYFVLGSLSSGLLLYGASLTYGFAGTTDFSGIVEAAKASPDSLGIIFGMVFLCAGLAFKVSAVPFHMWAPDVYEGAPTPVTAFFATAPKMAAMALFARLLVGAFGDSVHDWQQIVACISVLSMFVGSVAAIGQTNIKRLMAYSSIAHMGYALMGLAAGTQLGVHAMLVYMAIYVTMNVGTFALILSMERDGRPVLEVSGLNQLAAREPGRALAVLVLLFSMAGVPPMLGFFGKWAVMLAAVDAGLTWLAVAGVIASVIGAFYYLRIVYLMYFGAETEPLDRASSPVLSAFLTVTALIMILGIGNTFGVDTLASQAAASLVH